MVKLSVQRIRLLFVVLLVCSIAVPLALVVPSVACATAKPTVVVTRANTGKVTLKKGSKYKLAAKASAGKLTYKSSKPKVASVSKAGVLKALRPGTTVVTVTAKSGKVTAAKRVKVTVVAVKKYKQVKRVTAKAASATLVPGGTTKVIAAFTPKNASNKNVLYKSSAPAVASVSTTGVVRARKAGTAKITVTSCANAKAKANVTVTVKAPAVPGDDSPEDGDQDGGGVPPTGITVTASAAAVTVGETAQLSVVVTPERSADARVTYASSDTSVLEVDADGVVVAKAPGTAAVTISSVVDSGVSATVEVTVKAQVVSPAPVPDAPGIEEAAYDEEATTVDLERAQVSDDGTQATVDAGVLRQAPAVGQIVVIADDNLQGTAIKVESVTQRDDGSYDIQGTQPAFEEVFDELEIERNQGFTENDIVWMDEDVELVGVEEAGTLSTQSVDEGLYAQAEGTINLRTFKLKLTHDFWEKKGFGDKLEGNFDGEFELAVTPLVDWALDYNGVSITRLKVMPRLAAEIGGGIALSGTFKAPMATFGVAGTDATLYLKVGAEGKLSFSYEIDIAAGIDWPEGKLGFLGLDGSAKGSHEFSVEGSIGLDLGAEVGLLCFEVGSLDLEAGGRAKGTFTIRNADLWCSDINAWVFAELSYAVNKPIAKLTHLDHAEYTVELWNEDTSLVKTPKWHFENGERVQSCTWQAGDHQPVLDNYSWDELKAISEEIAAAPDNSAGLAIAKKYHLVDVSGKLWGDTKAVVLANGTAARVRILGFRHDDLAAGGKAGITFEFANVPTTHRMNPTASNAGGWESSEMRSWLNTDFINTLPPDLSDCIKVASKQTNNTGYVGREDTSVVTPTFDKLWLLSMREVYGAFSGQSGEVPTYPAIYDCEGAQYQLYADQGVTSSNYSYCVKGGLTKKWWLRSPYPTYTEYFRGVYTGGGWSYSNDGDADGVSPGFCI